jgi:hypothetical protein
LESGRLTRLALGAGIAAALLIVGAFVSQYWFQPAVVHYDNLKYIQLLRTACSSQRADQLDGVVKAVSKRYEEGGMSDAEYKEFKKIFDLARKGDWRRADQQAYRLELGQLHRSRP